MSKLREAAQALLKAMVNTDFTCRLGEETDALEAALAESEPTGERAELIKNLRSNGEGCECEAYSSNECGCDVTWGSDYTSQAADMLEADDKSCAQTMRMEDAR